MMIKFSPALLSTLFLGWLSCSSSIQLGEVDPTEEYGALHIRWFRDLHLYMEQPNWIMKLEGPQNLRRETSYKKDSVFIGKIPTGIYQLSLSRRVVELNREIKIKISEIVVVKEKVSFVSVTKEDEQLTRTKGSSLWEGHQILLNQLDKTGNVVGSVDTIAFKKWFNEPLSPYNGQFRKAVMGNSPRDKADYLVDLDSAASFQFHHVKPGYYKLHVVFRENQASYQSRIIQNVFVKPNTASVVKVDQFIRHMSLFPPLTGSQYMDWLPQFKPK
ncbi:hypothetical protein FNH22_19525 [Fulvivirga sp. M361]|uniref:hypothetical protein n=1 Tax=Fulvivirga sp. M361 TaxID=2594266 RepID=UPI00117AB121|nr:hypothetical protein [Fulvivirga sp. M361]TRX54309.1 hypothetical protein FNH22_19525 [Fulvivirga sp. M361]